MGVQFVNETSLIIFIRQACCSHYQFHRKFGVILPWILLKGFLKLVASQ